MNKANYLYGRYATPIFTSLAVYFCNVAIKRLRLNLTDVVRDEGLTHRQEDISRAIDFWSKRLDEFRQMK